MDTLSEQRVSSWRVSSNDAEFTWRGQSHCSRHLQVRSIKTGSVRSTRRKKKKKKKRRCLERKQDEMSPLESQLTRHSLKSGRHKAEPRRAIRSRLVLLPICHLFLFLLFIRPTSQLIRTETGSTDLLADDLAYHEDQHHRHSRQHLYRHNQQYHQREPFRATDSQVASLKEPLEIKSHNDELVQKKLFQENESPNRVRRALIERSRFQQQHPQQQLSPSQAEISPLESLSNVTAMETTIPGRTNTTFASGQKLGRRRSRSADQPAPGQLQLQEARRKKADQQQSGPQQQNAKPPGHKRQLIHAMLNGQATLTCNLQPPSADDSVSLVLWYKDKSMVPIYSVDARSGPIEEARHKQGPWLEGRSSLKMVRAGATSRTKRYADEAGAVDDTGAYLAANEARAERRRKELAELDASLARLGSVWANYEAGDGAVDRVSRFQVLAGDSTGLSPMALTAPLPAANQQQQRLTAHLHIESLSSEDNGVYSCRVDFRKARSRTQESLLKIIVPADTPTIRDVTEGFEDTPPRASDPQVGHAPARMLNPHNEGSKLVLECETQGGYPEPQLTWWRDGKLVDDSYEVLVPGQSSAPQTRLASSTSSSSRQPLAGDTPERFRSRLDDDDDDDDGQSLFAETDEQMAPAASQPPGSLPGQSSSSGTEQDDESNLLPATETSASSEPTARNNANSKQVHQNKVIRNRLELIGLTRADLFANYLCQAWNTKLSEPPSSSIMIDMNLRPIKVQIDNDRQPVLADKPVELTCRAFGSRPAALISWWRDGFRLLPAEGQVAPSVSAPVQPSGLSEGANVTSSTLTIVPRLEDGGKLIVCRAENPNFNNKDNSIGAGWIEDSWKLDVHYLPHVKLALGDRLAAGPVHEGHDVYFECSVQANPIAQEIRWWFDGRELEANVSGGVIISNQSLVLQRVSKHQRGRYTCSAINQVGEAHSNSLHLRVQYAPVCRDSQAPEERPEEQNELFQAISQRRYKTHYGAARLESVRVQCHVDADPADSLAYRWAFVAQAGESNKQQQQQQVRSGAKQPEFNGQQLVYLDASSFSNTDEPLVSEATYTPRSELDYGTLLCWAQNAIGQQGEPCAYQVVPAERPDPVRNCRLVNASDSQLVVGCEPGYDGGVDQRFQMEVYDSRKHELVANVTSNAQPISSKQRHQAWLAGSEQDNANQQTTGNTTANYQDDDDAQRRPAEQPASLVSEPVVSRQQKQRHSQQSASLQPGKSSGSVNGNAPTPNLETVFITNANLKPATDYFLSIYSSNSKGSSKPVAFTATTTNFTGSSADEISVGLARNRDSAHRPIDPSHLLSDVLALSWNPFLMLFGLVLTVLVLLASITFAMMKYIDFSPAGQRGGAGGSGSGATHLSGRRNDKAEDNEEDGGSRVVAATVTAAVAQPDQFGARVVTVANGSALSERAPNNIPLNGIDRQADRRSLLNGSYLKLKLQQIAGQVQWTPVRQLKQSNSDNFIDQIARGAPGQVSEAPHKRPLQLHQQAVFNSAGATLPKKVSHLQTQNQFQLANAQLQILAKLNQQGLLQQQQQQQQVVQLQDFESPYGGKAASLAGSASPSAGYSANSYSATTSTTTAGGYHLHEPAALGALIVSGAPQTNGIGSSSSSSSYLAASGYPALGEPQRVEQLVISGKQYIHQTASSLADRANIYRQRHQLQQQQQQQQQQQHLQMTTGAYGGNSLQRNANNLYSAPMKDYLNLQQRALYMPHHVEVCEHTRLQAAMGGGANSAVVDQVIDGGACFGGTSCVNSAAQAVDSHHNIQLAAYRNGQLINENYSLSTGTPTSMLQTTATPLTNYTVNNNTTSNSNKNQQQQHQMLNGNCLDANCGGIITSDLGDEDDHDNDNDNTANKSLQCDNNNAMITTVKCQTETAPTIGHQFNLSSGAVLNGAVQCNNLDSDGMSSAGQRSILTVSSTGSPSNGSNLNEFNDQLAGKHPHHPQCNQVECNQQNKHITGDESDLLTGGGSVVGVTTTRQSQTIRRADLSATNITNGIIKQAKKSRTKGTAIINKDLHQTANRCEEPPQTMSRPQMEQYTMYVDCYDDGNNNNNNFSNRKSQQVDSGDFYVFPVENQFDQLQGSFANLAPRVRLVEGNTCDRAGGYTNANPAISSNSSSSSSSNNMKIDHLSDSNLHTDV